MSPSAQNDAESAVTSALVFLAPLMLSSGSVVALGRWYYTRSRRNLCNLTLVLGSWLGAHFLYGHAALRVAESTSEGSSSQWLMALALATNGVCSALLLIASHTAMASLVCSVLVMVQVLLVFSVASDTGGVASTEVVAGGVLWGVWLLLFACSVNSTLPLKHIAATVVSYAKKEAPLQQRIR